MSVTYELNCGQYVMHRDGHPVTRPMDEVGLAFAVDGTLHKHGEVAAVNAWYTKTRKTLLEAGLVDMANDLVVIQGRFELEALNRCLSTTGYVGVLYKLIQEGKGNALGYDGVVQTPESA